MQGPYDAELLTGHIEELILQRWANYYQEEGFLGERAEYYASIWLVPIS